MNSKNKIVEKALSISYELRNGGMFAIELEPQKYHSYYQHEKKISYENDKPLNILDNADGAIVKALASIDGATIVTQKGDIMGFCATLTNSANFPGHGKRHAFAMGTSRIKGIICILASEEDQKIRIFKEGICVSEFDMENKAPVKLQHKIIQFLTSPVSGTIMGAGIAASLLTMNPIPAIITISGSSVLVSQGFNKIRELLGIRSK